MLVSCYAGVVECGVIRFAGLHISSSKLTMLDVYVNTVTVMLWYGD